MKPPRNERPAAVVDFDDPPFDIEPRSVPAELPQTMDAPFVPDEHDPRAWLSLEAEPPPLDGSLIEFKAEPQAAVAYARWRITRRRDHKLRRWIKIGFWSDPITREPIAAEPKIWRRPDGYLTPGLIV